MIDPRIYRATLIPVALALVLAAFSLQNRPQPLRTALAPDAFQGERAFERAYGPGGLSERFARRRPGSPDDRRLADHVAAQLRAARFRVRVIEHEGETIDGRRRLRAVVGQRPGTIGEQIVVVAHRDAAGSPAEAQLSGTAALLELARIFGAPRQTRRTLTLVSTSGGSGGAAGAAALARELRSPAGATQLAPAVGAPVGAVLVLGDLASRNVAAPLVTPWSNALGASPQRLRATVQEAVRLETGSGAGPPRALSQFVRFALPATYGEQGALLAGGLPAVLLSIGGDRPPPPTAPISRDRLEAYGRAALRTVTVLDGAPEGRALTREATSADLLTSRKVLPGWAVRLLTGALLLSVLVTAVDGLAALRRRRERFAFWLRWTLATVLPFALAATLCAALGTSGLLGPAPGAPVDPAALPVRWPALAAIGLAFALGWAWLRPRALRALGATDAHPSEPGAGVALVLTALALAAIAWIANPYTAALLVPALHLWLFALAPVPGIGRAARVAAVAASALPVAAVAVALASALGLGPVEAVWQLVVAVAGGHASLGAALMGSALAGCLAGALAVARSPRGTDEDSARPITVRGPATYAGPGSLGGTESALRR